MTGEATSNDILVVEQSHRVARRLERLLGGAVLVACEADLDGVVGRLDRQRGRRSRGSEGQKGRVYQAGNPCIAYGPQRDVPARPRR